MSFVRITVLKNEVPWGPFSPEQIQDGLRRGDFTLATLAHCSGSMDWLPLGEVLKQLDPSEVILPPVPTGRELPPVPGYIPPSTVVKGPPPPPAFVDDLVTRSMPPSSSLSSPSVARSAPPPLIPPSESFRSPTTPASPVTPLSDPARFFPRFVAFAIDVAVLFVPVLLLFGLAALAIGGQGMVDHSDAETMNESWDLLLRNFRDLLILVALGGAWLYAALLECSRWQATVGKQWIGLKVVDQRGQRLSFFHSTGRHVAKFLSALPLFLGFTMALFSPTGLTLHDWIARTRVVTKTKM